jgi:xanthine dehydrogenase YagS FAD-binding subunit
MQQFTFVAASDLTAATAAAAPPDSKFIAGGTDLMQLMKEDAETPTLLVDLVPLLGHDIQVGQQGLRIEAGARMADVAAHPQVVAGWPVVSQALLASASPQVRNMATIGGNLLQRTRCLYFRDTGFACNKRNPGSGCPALQGDNRELAILGTSEYCIANHPSDLAVALVALDARLELQGPAGARQVPLAEFHREPGDRPDIETNLLPGEVIRAVFVPAGALASRSAYLKVRDRSSFAFALTSAAVALDIANGTIRAARVAVGGVATRPWRLPAVEAALVGQAPSADLFEAAARHAPEGARTTSQNSFKTILLTRTVARALRTVAA